MEEQSSFFRYRRQTQLNEFGPGAQQKLKDSKVVLVGCGGLGTVISNYLVRAGIGELTIIDYDIVKLDNLQRQILFNEEDSINKRSKAEAAAEKLAAINSEVLVHAVVEKLTSTNAESLFKNADLIFDGTDDMYTRFLINDTCLKLNVPWIYGGAEATFGMSFSIVPFETPCLRCFIEELPKPGDYPKCSDVGVISSAVSIIASVQVTEGIKYLIGDKKAMIKKLIQVDVWNGNWEFFEPEKRVGCPACDLKHYEFLNKDC
jgi:molybdopterin-synthase adenylyltransferase